MANEVSKKEFLKRYLENEEESSRKRKKKSKLVKPKANIPSLKIVNEDIDLKSMNFGEKADDDDEDEAPVVAEIIDDRPVEVKLKELYDSSRWKKMNSFESSQTNLIDQQGTVSSDRKTKNRRHDSDGDLSPLRDQKRSDYSPQSHKQKKRRHESDDSDVSPPRNLKKRSLNKSDNDISPTHSQKHSRNRYDSDSDLSPPRSRKQSRNKHNSDSDLSPPRNQKQQKSRHNSDSDLSPERDQKQIKSRHNSDSDLSPPRSHKVSSTKTRSSKINPDYISELLKLAFAGAAICRSKGSAVTFKSIQRGLCTLLSSFGIQEKGSAVTFKSIQRGLWHLTQLFWYSSKGKNKLDKTLSGLKAGLQDSKSLQEEVQKLRKREKSQLNMLDDEISGKNADTIMRDRRTGKKRDLDKEQENKDKEDHKNKEYLQKYEKWGKGTETRNEHLEKLQDEIHEMTKPLARYEDDADLDERLKSIIHDDDPMSAYMKKKKQKETGVPNHPVYTGPPAPPNRYNLIPGFRWDGVDRSNGFEAKYFEKINQTKAVQDEAYLWSVQDM